MHRPVGIFALAVIVLACVCFLAASTAISVSDLTATREIAWGLFFLGLSFLLGAGGYLYGSARGA